ncbi:MAG: hypothetical protein M3P96_16095 [Actinomycetota bacterium]|nr:hypothetical protein [Actinomycetota bacterium]
MSLWVRDQPSPFGPGPHQKRLSALAKLGGEVVRVSAEERRRATKVAAAKDVGVIDGHTLLLIGAALY